MSTTYFYDHDWGDNTAYDLENLFKPHHGYDIDNKYCNNNIESVLGRASILGKKFIDITDTLYVFENILVFFN